MSIHLQYQGDGDEPDRLPGGTAHKDAITRFFGSIAAKNCEGLVKRLRVDLEMPREDSPDDMLDLVLAEIERESRRRTDSSRN